MTAPHCERCTKSHGGMRISSPNSASSSVVVYLPERQKAVSASRFSAQSWRISSSMYFSAKSL